MITRTHSVLSSRTPNTKRTTITNNNTNSNYNDKTTKLKIDAWRKPILFISIPILALIFTFYLGGFMMKSSTQIVKEHQRVHPNQVIPEIITEVDDKLEVFNVYNIPNHTLIIIIIIILLLLIKDRILVIT